MRMPLVDGMSNFGSVDGDPPAAYRYTEAKLTAVADHLLAELRQRTVAMRPTYNAETEEPVVLPAQFPNLLVNGASGIAVGMATNIPPHNLGDVIKAAVLLIDEPDATTAQLLDKLKGPDFPLGGKILTDRPTLRKIYEEGTGSIRVQGEWKVGDDRQERADHHHLDSLRRQQGHPGSGHRRHHRRAQAAATCSISPTNRAKKTACASPSKSSPAAIPT